MATNYRRKWNPESNVARRTDISVLLNVAAAGNTVTVLAPIGGPNQATNVGYLITATKVGPAITITLDEQYLKLAVAHCQVLYAGALPAAASQRWAQVSNVTTLNSVTPTCTLTLTDSTGAASDVAVPVQICVELKFINTTSPVQ